MHVRIRAERSHASHRALVPLVTGVLIGVCLSTLFLMPPYTSITNVYLQLPSEKENSLGRLSKLDRMLSDLTASRHSGVRRLAEEVMVKPKVYYAIVMSHRHSSEQIKVLRDTWAQDIADRVEFYIPPERKGEQASEQYAHYGETEFDQVNAVELHNLHADFHMDVVSHMCRSKLNLAKWFFMAGDNVYVKTQALEKFLQPYENDLSIGCLGRPASKKSGATSVSGGCNEETGIVLSHSALSELCQKLQACNESKEEAEKGLKLGICMQKLGYECNKNTQVSIYYTCMPSLYHNVDFI